MIVIGCHLPCGHLPLAARRAPERPQTCQCPLDLIAHHDTLLFVGGFITIVIGVFVAVVVAAATAAVVCDCLLFDCYLLMFAAEEIHARGEIPSQDCAECDFSCCC